MMALRMLRGKKRKLWCPPPPPPHTPYSATQISANKPLASLLTLFSNHTNGRGCVAVGIILVNKREHLGHCDLQHWYPLPPKKSHRDQDLAVGYYTFTLYHSWHYPSRALTASSLNNTYPLLPSWPSPRVSPLQQSDVQLNLYATGWGKEEWRGS